MLYGNIKFVKEVVSCSFDQDIGNDGQRIKFTFNYFVELPKVAYPLYFVILFGIYKGWAGPFT